jgi:outer membrane protein insertion porin family
MTLRIPWTRVRRGLFWGFGLVVLLVVLVVVILETSPGRSALLRLALGVTTSRTGLVAQAESLEVAILRREVRVRALRLSLPGAEPLVRIADLRLAWAILPVGRGLVPESVEMEGVRIDLRHGDDGRWNLPVGSPASGAGAPILPLRIALRDVAITMSDRTNGLEAQVSGISLQAAGSRRETAGSLDIKDPLRWRAGNQKGEVTFTPAVFQLGQAFTLKEWSARSSEATVRLSGKWADVFGGGSLGLAFDADVDLRRLAARADTPLDLDGSLHLEGRISGARDGGPRADVTWRGDDTRAGGRRMSLAGHAVITGRGLEVGGARVGVAGGSVEGSGRVSLVVAEASQIEARWSRLDLGSLLAPAPAHPELSGLLSGHLRASWPGLEWRRAQAQMVVEAGDSGKDGVPLAGDARLDLRAGKWTLEAKAHSRDDARWDGQLGGTLGSLALGDTSVAGRLDLEIGDLRPLLDALRGVPVAGRGRGALLVSGTLGSPRAAFDLQGVGLRLGKYPPADLRAQGTIDRLALAVESFSLHAGSAHAQSAGRLSFANGELEGRYELDLPDLAALSSAFPAGIDPEGALHAKGSLAGTWSEPKATLAADGTDLRVAGQRVQTARFELAVDGQGLRADAVDLVQARGTLSAKGEYDRRDGEFAVSLHARTFEIAPLPAGLAGPEVVPLGGRVDLDFEGRGRKASPEGHGRLTLTNGQWEGRSLGPLAADLALTKEGLRTDLKADDLRAHAEVTVGLDSPHVFSATARLADSDLATAAKLLGLDASLVSGTVALGAKATGSFDDLRGATLSLTVDKLDGAFRGRPLRLDREAHLEMAPGRFQVGALDLAVGEGRLRLDGALDARGQGILKGRVQGRLGEFSGSVASPAAVPSAPASAAVRFDGTADVSFEVSGPPERPRVSAEGRLQEGFFRFDQGTAGGPDRPPIEHVNVQGSLSTGTFRIDRLEAAYAGASLVANGLVTGSFLKGWIPATFLEANMGPAPLASLHARVEGDAGLVLAPFVGDNLRSSGRTAVLTAELEADDVRPEAVRGEIRLEGADLHTSDLALSQETTATLKVKDGLLTLAGAAWTGPLTNLHLAATARIGPRDDPLLGADLDAELTGDGDLRLFQAFARGIESGGTGTFRVKVAGKAASFRTDGEIALHGGALRHRPTRVALDGLTGTLRWGPTGLEVDSLKGSLNGGPMEASGTLRRESGTGFVGAVRIQVRNAFLEWPPGLRAGLRANLVLEPQDDGLRLAGTLRVLDGTYRTREYFSLQVLDLVNRFSTGTGPSPLDPLRLDLSLKSSEDVQLDAVDGRLEVGIDLHLGGSVGRPEVGGRLTAAAGGQLFMSGRTYDVESAILDFTRGAGFEPYVQARASTRVSDYTVVADVAGAATRVKTRFAATPPLGEQDIIALLTSGRTIGAGGTASQADAFSMASGGFLGKTGQSLGLDSLKIASAADPQSLDFDPTAISSEADPASRLTFSKRLAANVSATFSRSLTKAGGYTWFVAWKAKRSLEVRVVQRDDQTGALEFRHDVTIGGGKPEERPSRRRRRRRLSGETVSAVRITGDAVDARLSDLKLREGQAFDYERWLSDRDRLEERLADAGYGEGRVLASREAPPSEGASRAKRTVALVYDVRRGPKTTLTIEGVPSPGGLRARIERSWRLGDFPSTIEAEALALARADLYKKGFLRAHVTARVSSSPRGDAKTLTVRAEPGAPVSARHLRFLGNARVSSDRLEALVRDPRRAELSWLAPEDLRLSVLAIYEREGLLAAKVEVPKLTFAGDVAELTVTIDEGPVVPIREVTVTGAERLTRATVLDAAALVEGQPFKPTEIEQAKTRVEAAYRSLGYNQATVSSHGDLDATKGEIKVELEVREGVREVLAEVEVQGGSPKTQARIRRRLGLTPGAPVVLDEWTEARRRIYESGLYQRVDLEPDTSPAAAGGDGDRPVKATLRVEEWPALRLRYGLQALTGGSLTSDEGRKDLQAGAVAEVSRQTILGHAAAVGLSVQVRKADQEARGYLSLPRTLGTPVRSSLFLTVTPEHTDDDVLGKVDVRKTELTWEERIRATRKLAFAAAYKVQWNRFSLLEPMPDASDSVDIKLARLVGTALFDARNDLIDTSRGAFSSASMEWGGGSVGSDYPLTRTFLQQFVYLPLSGGLVLGAAGRVERASGQGSAFLAADRLRAGGANTVRGFSEAALTSRSFINLLGGSTTLLVLNAEVRFPIYGPVRGVLFGDGAISKARFSDDSTSESIWSTGFGLRYVTPVGILRLDYGVPLDDGFRPRRGRVYFSLGQVF